MTTKAKIGINQESMDLAEFFLKGELCTEAVREQYAHALSEVIQCAVKQWFYAKAIGARYKID